MSRLSELLLVEALRGYLERAERPTGWLAGMADPGIARALARLHAPVARLPSTEELAVEAGMSRSAFVQRFTDLLGMGPGRYGLARRMAEAGALLRDTSLTAAEIAYRIGYEAPEAFSRAFRRETGLSPTRWRALRRTGAGEPREPGKV
jgi:AraC-like DNA-binding protein